MGFAALVWLPGLVGAALALRRRDLAGGLAALQLVALLAVSALFFGSIRLRTPTDPYALVLALTAYPALLGALRGFVGRGGSDVAAGGDRE